MYHATIVVTLRHSILDPQGKAVEHAIHSLSAGRVSNVRIGKQIQCAIDAPSRTEAAGIADTICKKLLANPVMEDYTVTIEERA
ncbi:MAG: phosphoribosylformylglycinamidine synthase subunit PurS [Ignavibacteriales bacterium]|nr:phosphoribosylformylglycinamidine synthase subunit PurS [Ignavibacteriales bacterium]